MTRNSIDLSRRKVLGGLGAVGLTSAGAGLGTSAFFSDTETFQNNTLTAGELDLKVDWEEHYSDWSEDEATEAPGVRMVDSADEVRDGEIGLPDAENPMIAVPDDELGAFMDATAIEAYPDGNENGGDGNGIQDPLDGYDACVDFADLDADLDPTGGKGLRTLNDDTYDSEAGEYEPLVNLDDVKPGDFGELTLSFHLCDNPGYVWLQGGLVDADENGNTEPEAADSDENGPGDSPGVPLFDNEGDESDDPGSTKSSETQQEQVELLDEMQTLLWYDEDGDNVYEPGGSTEVVDLILVFDQSESMNGYPNDGNPNKLQSAVDGAKALLDAVGGSTNVGSVFFSNEEHTQVIRSLGSAKSGIKQDLEDLDGPDPPQHDPVDDDDDDGPSGPSPDDDNLVYLTRIGDGIEDATNELTGANGRSGAKKIMVLLSDGQQVGGGPNPGSAAQAAKDLGIEIYTIAYGSGADTSTLRNVASDPKDTHAFVSSGPSDIVSIFGQIGQIIGGEECFFRGSMRELLTELSDGHGIPLDGNRDTPFDELADDPTSDARDEFVDSTNNFLGLAWYLPVDHANEIQSDSLRFDLGFYTEQSRHNSGAGQS